MANDLSAVTPQVLAQGLLALRENCVTPRLVNSDYGSEAAGKGSTIDVPIPTAIATNDVTPDRYAPADPDMTPTSTPIAMTEWREAPFHLSDKDLMEAEAGILPMQASEAIKALSNYVDAYVLALYRKFYGAAGAAGTTPFGTDTSEIVNARKLLNKQLAPLNDRRFLFDPDAEAGALNLRAFQDVSWTGDARAINDGNIIHKLGFDWFMNQNIPTHTAGTVGGAVGNETTVTGANLAGVTTLNVTVVAATTDLALVEGDIINIAGDSQQYVVTAAANVVAGAAGDISIYPGLAQATAGGEVITNVDTHVANLAFHRNAIAFANRPLADSGDGLGNIIEVATDPISGLSLRLEVSRQHKRTRWSYDILFGAAVVRRELGVRVMG